MEMGENISVVHWQSANASFSHRFTNPIYNNDDLEEAEGKRRRRCRRCRRRRRYKKYQREQTKKQKNNSRTNSMEI